MKDWVSWNEEYSVGIKHIDDQHKEIIDLINLLRKAQKEGKVKEAMDYALQKLLEYTLFHFSTEEDLFEKYQFPEKEQHKVEHGFFIKKVSDFKKEYDKGNLDKAPEVIAFLNGWLFRHISEVDGKYRKFFKENNIYPKIP